MKLRITGCKDPQMWYADQIGKTFDIRGKFTEKEFSYEHKEWFVADVYYVNTGREKNIVKGYDCRLILEHATHH